MPLPVVSRHRRAVLWAAMVIGFVAIIPMGVLVPEADALPPTKRIVIPHWKAPAFLLSRTLPPYQDILLTAPVLAADFEPWNAVRGPDGYYYGYVNDGSAQNGLIYRLRPYAFFDARKKPHPPGEASLVYRFPILTNTPPNRLQGSRPHGNMAVGQDGAIYGRLSEGGVFAAGVLYKLAGGIPQPIHHFEEKGNARDMIVAANGDIYSATAPEDPSQAWWLFRLSTGGGSKNIPAPAGQITALGETSDQRIIVGTSHNGQGALWRLNAADEFELLADHVALFDGVPYKLHALPGGELLCMTSHKILRVRTDGTVLTVLDFPWVNYPSFSPLPTLLIYNGSDESPRMPYSGSFKVENTDPRYTNTWFQLSEADHPPLQTASFGTVVSRYSDTWMDVVFRGRVFGDQGGKLRFGEILERGHLPPFARHDFVPASAFTVGPGGLPRATFPVLGNDADPERSSLKIVALGTPTNGVVKMDPTSQFVTYTANSAPVQNDSFTYTMSDGDKTATARVSIRTNPSGRYAGEVIPDLPEPAAQVPAGSLLVNVSADRSLTGTLDFEGRLYRFTRRFNAFGECAAVLMVDRELNQSLAIQLVLRPDGTRWKVDAVIQKDNTAAFIASCTLPGQ